MKVLTPVMNNPIEKVKKYNFANADLIVLWCRKSHKQAISIILISNMSIGIGNTEDEITDGAI